MYVYVIIRSIAPSHNFPLPLVHHCIAPSIHIVRGQEWSQVPSTLLLKGHPTPRPYFLLSHASHTSVQNIPMGTSPDVKVLFWHPFLWSPPVSLEPTHNNGQRELGAIIIIVKKWFNFYNFFHAFTWPLLRSRVQIFVSLLFFHFTRITLDSSVYHKLYVR